MNVANPSNACLILDDTDLKKTGFAMELVSWDGAMERASWL